MTPDDLCLFALDASRPYGERVATALGLALASHEEREFEDGEHKARPLENVRGKDVYVIQSLYGEPGMSANDKLVRLLFFIGALKDASAARVTAVCPYLAYSRKDRKTKSRDPVSSRYVAQLFEAVGTDRMVTLDVHNPAAYQNAFRIPAEHLEAQGLFVAWFAARLRGRAHRGGVTGRRRGEAGGSLPSGPQPDARPPHCSRLHGKAPQRRRGVRRGGGGRCDGRTALIVDDLISTGTTLARAASACKALGANRVYAAASHGMFVGSAGAVLADPALDKVLVTDSIPPFRLPPALLGSRVEVLASAPLFAEAIYRLHSGGSLVELLQV